MEGGIHPVGGEYEANYFDEILTAEALTEFIAKWKLQDEAQQILWSVPLQVQSKIVMEFKPRDVERDVNAIFIKFAKGVAGASQGSDDTLEFIKRWGLGPDASQMLQKLNPQMRGRVMREFSPRDTSSDVNNIFMKFAQGVANHVPRVGQGYGKGYGKGKYVPPPQQHMQQFGPITPSYHGGQQGGLGQFFAGWGLQQESQQFMHSLPPMTQQKIMQEFAPRDTSRDMNAIFMKFATGVAQKMGAFGASGGGGDGGFFQQAPMTPMATHIPHVPSQDSQGFLNHWRLGAESQQLFFGLLPAQQEKVMSEFCPRDPSSDCNNIFQRFCQGIARGTPQKVGKGGKGGFSPY
jgi:hypothetical protein